MRSTKFEDTVDVHVHMGDFAFLFAKLKVIKQSIFVIYFSGFTNERIKIFLLPYSEYCQFHIIVQRFSFFFCQQK